MPDGHAVTDEPAGPRNQWPSHYATGGLRRRKGRLKEVCCSCWNPFPILLLRGDLVSPSAFSAHDAMRRNWLGGTADADGPRKNRKFRCQIGGRRYSIMSSPVPRNAVVVDRGDCILITLRTMSLDVPLSKGDRGQNWRLFFVSTSMFCTIIWRGGQCFDVRPSSSRRRRTDGPVCGCHSIGDTSCELAPDTIRPSADRPRLLGKELSRLPDRRQAPGTAFQVGGII